METKSGDKLLTSGQVARRLGISKPTLMRAVARGEIAAAQRTPGGALRFVAAQVEAYHARLAADRTLDEMQAESKQVDGLMAQRTERAETLLSGILALLAESSGIGLVFVGARDGSTWHVVAAYDRVGMGVTGADVRPLLDLLAEAQHAGTPALIIAEDISTDTRFAGPGAAPASPARTIGACAGIPLIQTSGQLYGALCILYPQRRSISSGEIALLRLAARVVMQAIAADQAG